MGGESPFYLARHTDPGEASARARVECRVGPFLCVEGINELREKKRRSFSSVEDPTGFLLSFFVVVVVVL